MRTDQSGSAVARRIFETYLPNLPHHEVNIPKSVVMALAAGRKNVTDKFNWRLRRRCGSMGGKPSS